MLDLLVSGSPLLKPRVSNTLRSNCKLTSTYIQNKTLNFKFIGGKLFLK